MLVNPHESPASRNKRLVRILERSRRRFHSFESGAMAMTIGLMRRITPVRSHVVLCGHPPDEPSIVEMARALAERYDGKIFWLDTPPEGYLRSIGLANRQGLVRVRGRWTARALWAYLTAELVFTTHGLYGMPTAPKRKPVVDLWHGEATKAGGPLYPNRPLRSQPSTALVVSSKALSDDKLSRAHMPSNAALWVGAPRIDQLRRPVDESCLARLGIDPDAPFVLWMPTYRQARVPGKGSTWIHTKNPASDESLASNFYRLVASPLREAGINTVVKPHVLDVTSRGFPGAAIVTHDDLAREGVPLYSLLGRSAGLVTDYSSVWLDYLTIDKSLGFFMPDIEDYDSGTGADVTDAYDVLPGSILRDEAAVQAFVDDLRGSPTGASLRRMTIEKLGIWTGASASLELLRLLAERDLIPVMNLDR